MPDPNSIEPLPDPEALRTSDQRPATETRSTPSPEAHLPEKIGHYRIRRRIASGGMGTVYEATQENPRRAVAVKVMKQGVTSASAMRRFEFEAQLLARLDHAGIAQVFEAGTFDDGSGAVPFFAMEYIPNAKRITDYFIEKNMDARGRIAIFAQVCDAVQHGHQKGIIHRDLKPANILIDSHAQVKVIDFGVARATDSDLALTTLQTDVGQLIGTLQYMSPEQCEGDARDLDARSDVYSLGVLLYEILCRRLPYDLSGMSISAATRVIRQFQPPRPGAIASALRGDVETVLLKAMEKDRERRYRTAADLGDDLRRTLNDEPILARPASLVYQVRVYARRNRAAFGAALLIFLAVMGGLMASTYLYFRAEAARTESGQQRDAAIAARGESEAVTGFLHDTLASVDPENARGPTVTVMQMLDDAAAKIGGAFTGRPLVEAALRRTIGNSYTSLENFKVAEGHLRKALELRQRTCPPDSLEVAQSEHDLAEALMGLGRPAESERLYRQALATRRKRLGGDDRDLASTLNSLAVSLLQARRHDAAEPLLREALEIRRRALGNEHKDVAATLDNLAEVFRGKGQFDQAANLHREALAILRKVVTPDHVSLAYTLSLLGYGSAEAGDWTSAEGYLREALAITSALQNPRPATPQNTRWVTHVGILSTLAHVLYEEGKPAEAERLQRDALQVTIAANGEENAETAKSMTSLAGYLMDQQNFAEAEDLGRKALALQRRLPSTDSTDLADALHVLGVSLFWKRDYAGAEPLLRESLGIQRNSGSRNTARLAATLNALGATLSENGKADEAEPLLRDASGQLSTVLGADDWRTGNARSHLGACLQRLGRFGDSERELLEAYRILSTARKAGDVYVVRTVERLVGLYDAWDAAEPGHGYAEQARMWRAKLSQRD